MTQPTAPAGWYPVGDSERYWDGQSWTEHVRAPTTPPGAPQPGVVYDRHGLPHAVEPGTSGPATAPIPSSQPQPPPPPGVGYGPPPPVYGSPQPVYPWAGPHPRPGYGYVQQPYPVGSPKSPGGSLVASFFIPGLGTMINGDVSKGIGILIGYSISWLLSLIIIGVPFLVAFWIWGMVDAYQGAKEWNARHGFFYG